MIIRIFRPTIYPGKESEFESFSATRPYRSYRSSQGSWRSMWASHAIRPPRSICTSRFGRTFDPSICWGALGGGGDHP